MRFGSVAGLASAGLACVVAAEDLLFHSTMTDTQEYIQATTVLGLTAHVASPEEWASYTTADFEKYKAIVIPDPTCGSVNTIDFFDLTKAVWSPAVKGNIILIGTDPTFHSSSQPGALTLIDDAILFSASGNGTGLYFALSCYYDSVDSATVDSLSYFGTITVRGRLACYNDAHLVAGSTALNTLDDAALSDWSCSVHEVFSSYPTTGVFGFVPLAIAQGATGDGQEDFADGSNGVPYIIVKGAVPDGCGDGVWDASLEEECDDGTLNGTPESSCSSSCKCLNGAVVPGCASISHQLITCGHRFVLGANSALRVIYKLERSTGIVNHADCARREQLIGYSFTQHRAIRDVLVLRTEQLDRDANRSRAINRSKPEVTSTVYKFQRNRSSVKRGIVVSGHVELKQQAVGYYFSVFDECILSRPNHIAHQEKELMISKVIPAPILGPHNGTIGYQLTASDLDDNNE
ncbi:hypothetical protein UCDDA912_g08534 [Diaporthe ampelina]|uniref:Uncharacterized protein n=1 Tax=Diaporthe ampelina TaxID=1214573 RepID=A0A0G2FA24_9PEZI|nr:hypothetical protein UCDDA912_g08534 [Diaporthe ampelina]